MNRNTNSHFATNPTSLDMARSRFSRNQSIKLTMNTGDIIPFYVDEVLPGDTMSVDTAKLVRMQTLLTPVMDNIYLDTYYFFVPNRLVWEHWKEFMGENNDSDWLPTNSYSVPQISAPSSTGWNVGTIADYFGIPTGVTGISVSALPFRAYALICNDWFRSENLTDPLNIPRNDSNQTGTNGNSYINDVANGGMPFKAAKYFDYFTGALPAPQKGPDVTIDLGYGNIPVVGNGYNLGVTNGTALGGLAFNGGSANVAYGSYGVLSPSTSGTGSGSFSNGEGIGVPTLTQLGNNPEYSGLVANLDATAVITINQLREAFQIQKFYEKSARGGTRYIEILKSMFGVTSPDARLQRPEYLGGNRISININQVVPDAVPFV